MGIRSFIGIIAILALTMLSSCPQSQPATDGQAAAPAREASKPRKLRLVCDPLLVSLLETLEPELGNGLKGIELEPLERGELLDKVAAGEKFAGVDAFLFSDPEVRSALSGAGLLSEATMRTFAGDRLALIARKGESWRAESLFDIYRLRFKWLGVGSERTVTGYYAPQALVTDGVMPRVEDRLSHPDTAAAILQELLDNGSQMAIVPRSLIVGNEETKLVLLLPRDLHEDFIYQAAAASGLEDDSSVMALLTGLAENDAVQALIAGYGFDNRDEAMGLNVAPE
ncbi:substrate-binding domain-containing protein [bacterium]|nr:substrate-binding domain-containing protein [bacterium]